MKFTSNGYGRKNGFYFDINYEFYHDGEKAIQPWTVSVERRDAEGRVSNFVRLHRTHRFENKEDAQQFCEDIADGKYSIEELRKEEDAAVAAHNAAIETEKRAKLSAFLQDFKSIGVDPMLLPVILQKVHGMDPELRVLASKPEKIRQCLQAEQPKMLMLCEEYENDDGIRSFTVLAVSEDEEMLQKLLAAKVEKDEYGFIAKNGISEYDNPNHFLTEFQDGFVEYYILEENVLSREQLQEMLQTKDYQKIHTYPDNFRDILTNIVEVYAERNHYGHIDAEKAADALINDDKFYATIILDTWWANNRTLRPSDLKFAQSDISYYLSDLLSEKPDFFINCGAVARVEYPEGMQDLLVDCIYADAMKHRQPLDIDVAESLATRIMHNADFAKAIGITLADLKEQGRTCEAKDFRVFCEEFVRHELSPEEKPALDQQISGAQSRTSSSTPEKSTPDIQR